jgi:hypothetical protein
MEQAYENIILKNAGDVIDERRGFINESQIRQISIMATAETRSQVLFISEDVRQKLGLKVLGEKNIRMNGTPKMCKFTDLLEVHRKTSHTFMPALIFSGVNQVLLVTAPLEGMFSLANNEPRRRAARYRRPYTALISG